METRGCLEVADKGTNDGEVSGVEGCWAVYAQCVKASS